MSRYNVAVVGATGAVGEQMRLILAERDFPVDRLRLIASERSTGKRLDFKGSPVEVETLTAGSFAGIDIALFSSGAGVSREFAPAAVAAGAIVIDNSSAFRMDPEVPLVVPEVNPEDIKENRGIIANPNCSTIQMVLALYPLHLAFKIKRVVVSTYQSVSGTGKEAVSELLGQSRALLDGKTAEPKIYPHQIAFNVLPQIDAFDSEGNTKEELKMINETRKIMHLPRLPVAATAVRVPVITGHGESVNIEFEEEISVGRAREILSSAPGVTVMDDPGSGLYPMPINSSGKDASFVGRIRRDDSVPNGLNIWIVSDNLRKGAALNTIQIAEKMIAQNFKR